MGSIHSQLLSSPKSVGGWGSAPDPSPPNSKGERLCACRREGANSHLCPGRQKPSVRHWLQYFDPWTCELVVAATGTGQKISTNKEEYMVWLPNLVFRMTTIEMTGRKWSFMDKCGSPNYTSCLSLVKRKILNSMKLLMISMIHVSKMSELQ